MINNMKRFAVTIALVCATLGAFAQKPVLRPRMELVQSEEEAINGLVSTSLEVFYMGDEDPRTYYLSVGHLGMGGDIIQLEVNPLFELFIPLGNTLEEAIAKMEEIKGFFKQPKLSTMELTGSYALAYPTDELVTITLTRRQLIATKVVEFSIPTPGSDSVVQATYVSKSEFSGIVNSLKFYKKLHPKQK